MGDPALTRRAGQQKNPLGMCERQKTGRYRAEKMSFAQNFELVSAFLISSHTGKKTKSSSNFFDICCRFIKLNPPGKPSPAKSV